jgi:hypothetical protein
MVPSPPPTIPTTKREELNEVLVEINGSRNVYFQPDEKIRIVYPAIVYEMDDQYVVHASNHPYHRKDRYQVTLIDRDPDVPASRELEKLPMCVFSRAFASEGLNHRIYSLYF